jgi:hypothetical protein
MLFEAVVKTNAEYVGGKQYTFLTRTMMGYLHNGDFFVDLPLTKKDSVSYLAKVSGHEELLPLIETATMSKDFSERNKAQKELNVKLAPCRKWLKENLYEICSNREKPKISQEPQTGNYIIEYRSFEGKPYIKIKDDVKTKQFSIISFHDESMVLKKKSYSDTNSYKFGSREIKQKIKERIQEVK